MTHSAKKRDPADGLCCGSCAANGMYGSLNRRREHMTATVTLWCDRASTSTLARWATMMADEAFREQRQRVWDLEQQLQSAKRHAAAWKALAKRIKQDT